eukprot:6008044-Alexandrium_andersonii.AAC.1
MQRGSRGAHQHRRRAILHKAELRGAAVATVVWPNVTESPLGEPKARTTGGGWPQPAWPEAATKAPP